MSHITKEELVQLLGGEQAVGIQCVFTEYDSADELFEMSEKSEATHISVYLRLPVGEVVPVRDFPVHPGQLEVAQVYARDAVTKICELLGTLPVEPHGALS